MELMVMILLVLIVLAILKLILIAVIAQNAGCGLSQVLYLATQERITKKLKA